MAFVLGLVGGVVCERYVLPRLRKPPGIRRLVANEFGADAVDIGPAESAWLIASDEVLAFVLDQVARNPKAHYGDFHYLIFRTVLPEYSTYGMVRQEQLDMICVVLSTVLMVARNCPGRHLPVDARLEYGMALAECLAMGDMCADDAARLLHWAGMPSSISDLFEDHAERYFLPGNAAGDRFSARLDLIRAAHEDIEAEESER